MPSASDRARRVRAAAAELRDAPRPDFDPENPLCLALASASLPEIIALTIAAARNDGVDEVEHIEVFIRALPDVTREELLDWNATLQPLGYTRVSGLLRRMARHAPSKPPMTIFERVRARRAARRSLPTVRI
jgi:hypothetical protein